MSSYLDIEGLKVFKDNIDGKIPTKTSDLNNDSNYITGITSDDVINALGYKPTSVTELVDTTFEIRDGYLWVIYPDTDTIPNLRIDEQGYLIYKY